MSISSSGGVAGAARAGLWSAADLLLRQGVQFGISVALARLLNPADFGLVALMSFFSTLVTVLIQNGVVTALIQRHGTTREQESAIFWVNVAASAVLALALVVLSGSIAAFYRQPLLQPLLYVASATVIVSAAGAVHGALLNRELAFATIMKVGIVSTLIAGASAVALAYLGYGAWSLAIMTLISAALHTIGYWAIYRWRPLLVFRAEAMGEMIGYGGWVSLSGLLDVLYTQGFALLIGKLYGVREVGFFNRGASTQLLPSTVLSQLVSRIALPLFSARADEPDAIRRGARMAIGFAMLLNVPAMVGLALCAPLVIEVLYGAKWLAAAPILAILAISGVLLPLHVINLQIILAQGQSQLYFRLEIAKKVVGIACVVVGSLFAIQGLAWAQVAASVLALGINTWPVGRMIGYPGFRQLLDLRALALPTAAMAIAVVELGSVVGGTVVTRLALLAAAGSAVYFGVGFATRARIFLDAWSVAAALGRGARPALGSHSA